MSTLLGIAVGVLAVAVIALVIVVLYFRKHETLTAFPMRKSHADSYFLDGLGSIAFANENIKTLLQHLKKQIVGVDAFLHGLILAMLAWWHVLVEGAPGLAKTKSIRLLSSLLALDTKRIQFTPDMLPADLIGVDMFNQAKHTFETYFGPLFTNILLADEINRATPKVQSALLEAMQEHQVTIGGKTYPLNTPYFVMATQNPIEQNGTYPLPEAQLDRFMMKLTVDYPAADVEKEILRSSWNPQEKIESILTGDELLKIQTEVMNINVSDDMMAYIAELVSETRKSHVSLVYGASPRWSLAILSLAKALAFAEGRNRIEKKDVQRVVLPALRHRIILSVEAQMNQHSDADILYNVIGDKL